jgi:hypothetical protein
MQGIPNPLGNIGFSDSLETGVPSVGWKSANDEQYRGQWGEDWLRQTGRERLNTQKSIFQELLQRGTEALAREVPVAPAGRPGESGEMEWLITDVQEVERHKGEWLVIQGGELMGHSQDFSRIRTLIAERHIRSPFVYYVPTDEESNWVTI